MEDETRIREHATTLLRANEDLHDFTIESLLFALNRYHDRALVVDVLSDMQENKDILMVGRRPILSEDEDE